MKLKDLKISQIKRLTECYWVQHPMNLNGTRESNNLNKKIANILQLNNANILYGITHYMLYDEDHIFTTLQEAIKYCNEHNWDFNLEEKYDYKSDLQLG